MVLRTHKPRIPHLQLTQIPKTHPRYIAIPHPQPADCTLALSSVIGESQAQAITSAGKIVFHCVGDTGGILGENAQDAVALAMENQYTNSAPTPSFFYHLGDVVYYNGQSSLYEAQYYEPYKYYPVPIFAIPGNHDGDSRVRPGDAPDGEPSLYGFFENFCAQPDTHISTYRDAMIQPYVYWTLQAPYLTIIGLYGNVDGNLDAPGAAATPQQQWLTEQLKQADPATCILVAVHQPPYSLDAAHGGYGSIGSVIDAAARAAGVWPHAVLSGHVHDYQRFTRQVDGVGAIPYLVAGAGGYAKDVTAIHKLRRGSNGTPLPCPSPTSDPTVTLREYNEKDAGFLRITVDENEVTFEYYAVPFAGPVPTKPFDSLVLNHRSRTIVSEMPSGTSGAA